MSPPRSSRSCASRWAWCLPNRRRHERTFTGGDGVGVRSTIGLMPPVAARLTVSRNLPIDVRQRQIFVAVDGESWATLVFGQSASREIAPGSHTIRVHNTL